MSQNPIVYLELPSTNLTELKHFYGSLFGWSFQDWGGDYATMHGSGLEGGLNGHAGSRTKAPLAILETKELEVMQDRVKAAGGEITVPIFAYPGGRRFHFRDPQGNELAVLQADEN
ncbi:VOC family protein [Silvibacterium dinghuense]|uniref:VOC family protein n=1 Tax=Silvibacterium dinghuense TaxID=1560006 RepID=A0A4Q1S8A1_9BACT|nr:VOC family protein [Silvibacterium dinghuense]RXS93063.1 VOC family protein [Silvibacterium dinghuense]GGG89708.1 glyoxalase [Silvibacterium dinghuense]